MGKIGRNHKEWEEVKADSRIYWWETLIPFFSPILIFQRSSQYCYLLWSTWMWVMWLFLLCTLFYLKDMVKVWFCNLKFPFVPDWFCIWKLAALQATIRSTEHNKPLSLSVPFNRRTKLLNWTYSEQPNVISPNTWLAATEGPCTPSRLSSDLLWRHPVGQIPKTTG